MSNRSKFVAKLATELGTTKKDSDDLLTKFTKIVEEQLSEEGQVVFPGFGRLKTQVRGPRQGRNPRTGDVISIPEKTVYKFKAFK